MNPKRRHQISFESVINQAQFTVYLCSGTLKVCNNIQEPHCNKRKQLPKCSGTGYQVYPRQEYLMIIVRYEKYLAQIYLRIAASFLCLYFCMLACHMQKSITARLQQNSSHTLHWIFLQPSIIELCLTLNMLKMTNISLWHKNALLLKTFYNLQWILLSLPY